MAHSKSAIKRWRQSIERRDRNRSVKSETRTLLNKAVVAIESDPANAEEAVRTAVSALDRAAQKTVIHANAASRGKSRLLKRYNLATATAVAVAAGSEPEKAEPKKPASSSRAAAKKPAAKKPAAKKPATRRTPKS